MEDRPGRTVHIAPDHFLEMLDMVEKGECVLIDVRNPEEFRAERLEGAVNVPVDTLRNNLGDLDRDTPLLIYCKVGKRCVKAVDQLNEMGFHDIKVLDGGIESLKAHNKK